MPLENAPLCFARDENGHRIVPGRLATGMEAILILCRAALGLWRDEWFLNRDVGMPWLPTSDGVVSERDAVLGQAFDPVKTARAVRRELLQVPGVVSIPTLQCAFDSSTRNLTVTFVVRAAFGDSEVATVALAA